jgi:very-short-patch-repair endonuclease
VSSSLPAQPSAPSQFRSLTLKQRARWLRHRPTSSESLLWLHLRGKQLGVQFRRQVVIGNHIVDFFASSIALVVEIDGGYHAERVALDAKRDARLRRRGFRVLRLSHELVVRQPLAAVELIRQATANR